jgi:hypothetical protein
MHAELAEIYTAVFNKPADALKELLVFRPEEV